MKINNEYNYNTKPVLGDFVRNSLPNKTAVY